MCYNDVCISFDMAEAQHIELVQHFCRNFDTVRQTSSRNLTGHSGHVYVNSVEFHTPGVRCFNWALKRASKGTELTMPYH